MPLMHSTMILSMIDTFNKNQDVEGQNVSSHLSLLVDLDPSHPRD